MKRVLFIFLLLINGVALKAQNESLEKQSLEMLKAFYTQYITTVANDNSDDFIKHLTKLQKQYCTKSLLAKLPQLTEKCDCDPFLKAQDSNTEFLKTLSIKKVSNQPNIYIVSYIADEKIIINLTVLNQAGSIKINNIW